MKPLTMTVVIPTYKPDERFKKLLHLLEKQTRTPQQILIINTEESHFGMTEDELPAHCLVRHIRRDQFDHGGTRDMAIQSCSTDVVVCMTMDAVPADERLLENLVKPFEENANVAAAYARQLPAEDCDVLERRNRDFNYGPVSEIHTKADLKTKGVKAFFCSNACAAWRRSTYLQMGGFEKRTIFNEDMIFAGKLILAGYSIAYAADAKVIHSHNYTGMQQLHRNFDLGVSQAQHPEVFGAARSESEGIRLVKRTVSGLFAEKKFLLAFKFLYMTGCRFIGYKLGKSYRKLPRKVILALTMNRPFWDKE